jgi:two-component system response regulator YesN
MAHLPPPAQRAAASVEQLLQREYTRNWTLNTLAAQFEVTTAELTEAFREHTGVDIPRYITRLRVAHSKEMLKPGVRIAEVAFALGYNSSHTFVDAFEKEMGVLPSEYRNRNDASAGNAA